MPLPFSILNVQVATTSIACCGKHKQYKVTYVMRFMCIRLVVWYCLGLAVLAHCLQFHHEHMRLASNKLCSISCRRVP